MKSNTRRLTVVSVVKFYKPDFLLAFFEVLGSNLGVSTPCSCLFVIVCNVNYGISKTSRALIA